VGWPLGWGCCLCSGDESVTLKGNPQQRIIIVVLLWVGL
jgi:hypothetical protein